MINDTLAMSLELDAHDVLIFLILNRMQPSVNYITVNYVMVNSLDFVKEYFLEAKLL